MKSPSALERLCDIVASVAPTLDVAVFCKTETGDTKQAIVPNDWETMPMSNLAKRIGDEPTAGLGARIEGGIVRQGKLIARVSLSPRRYDTGGRLVVGGFSTLRPAGKFVGVLLADEPSLSRAEAVPLVSEKEWKSFVDANSTKLSSSHLGVRESLEIAQLLLNFGIRPAALHCFRLQDGWTNTNGLAAFFQSIAPGESAGVVLEDEVSVDVLDDTLSRSLLDIDGWTQPHDIVLVGDCLSSSRPRGDIIAGFPPLPEGDALGFSKRFRCSAPNSLAAYAIEIAAATWGHGREEIVTTADREDLGEFDVRGESELIRLKVLRIHRP